MKKVYKGMMTFIFILVGLMLTNMTSLAATQQGGAFYYELNSKGEATLTGYIGESDYIELLTIPEQIDGYKVVAIGSTFISSDCDIDEVRIPASVTEIKEWAFEKARIETLKIYGKNTILKEDSFYSVENVYCYRDSKAYDYFMSDAYEYAPEMYFMGPYFDEESIKIRVNQSVQLKVKNSTGTVKWSSSNSKVATVSSKGKVKGLKPGTVTITAVVGDTTLKAKVKVEKMQLNKKNATVSVGFQVKLKLDGGKKIKWRSTNKNVATVSSKGVVQGKKKGTATIIATCNKKQYKCKVKVKANKRSLPYYNTSPGNYPSNMAAIGFNSIELDAKGNYVLKGHVINTYARRIAYIDNMTVTVKSGRKVIAKQKYGRLTVSAASKTAKKVTLTISKKKVKKKVDLRKTTVTVEKSGGVVLLK